jgi:hypothetical protein
MSLRKFIAILRPNARDIQILSVETFSPVSVAYGTVFGSIGLPSTIDADLNNGTTQALSIVWDAGTYDESIADVYNLTGSITLPAGIVNPLGFQAEIQVTVQASLNAPVNTVLPSISGTTDLGDTLTGSDGTWTGPGPITYARQWRRNGVDISGATGGTYIITEEDLGTSIVFRVEATNVNGTTAANSAATSIPTIELVLDSTVVSFDKDEFHFQDRVPNGKYEQGLIVDPTTGRILLSAAHPWSNQFYSLGLLHYYDPNDGFAPAAITTTEKQSEIDNHLTTSCHIHGDYVYIFQEDAHKQFMDIFRSPKDLSDFTKFDSEGNYARCSVYDIDADNFALLLQQNEAILNGDPLCIVIVNETTGMGSPTQLLHLESAGKRWYPMKPSGVDVDNDGYAHVVMVSSTSGGTEEYFHVKTPTGGADFMDEFYTPEGTLLFTVSIDGTQTGTIMRNNGCRVYGEYAGPNAADLTCCLDAQGRLYAAAHQIFNLDQTWTSSRRYDTLATTRAQGTSPYAKHNARYWATKGDNNVGNSPPSDVSTENAYWIEIDPTTVYGYGNLYFIERSGGAYVKTPIDLGVNPIGIRKYPDGRCVEWLAKIYNVYYLCVRIQDGSYGKFHLYKSTNKTTWTDMGDVFPGINENIHRCKSIDNYHQLQLDKNFAFYGCKVNYIDATPGNAQVGDVYAVRAAFETIKTEVPSAPPAAYTEMSDTPWKVLLESDNLTEAGGIISAIADGSGNGRTPTINGEIYYEDGAIKTYGSAYLSFASYADFQSDTRCTVIGVFRKVGNSYIMAMGDATDANKYMCLRVLSDGSIGWQVKTTPSNTDDVQSWVEILGNEYFVAVFVCTGYNFRIRINGVETNLKYLDDPITNIGQWFNFQTYSNLTIGAVTTTTTTTTPIDFKVIAYHDGVKTLEQIQKCEELLFTKYSITKGDFGTATTYEPEAELTFLRMTTDPPTTGEKEDYDDLIKAIKTSQGLVHGENNLGELFDTLYMRGAHDSQAALLNWARPKFDATAHNSPSFTANWGYESNGTTSYLNWNFNPSKHSRFASNNLLIGGYCLENPTRGNKAIIGLSVGSNFNARLFPRNASDNASLIVTAGTALTIGSVTDMREMYFARRVSTTRYGKRGTASETSGVTAATSFSNANVYELAENDDGTAAFFLDALVGFTFWGSNTINMDALRTAVRDWLIAKGVTGI